MRWNVCPDCLYRYLCVCCFWETNERKICAFTILYSKIYLCIYFIIVAVTITLVVYDVDKRHIFSGVESEPIAMKALDIICVALMVFDIFIQVLANPRNYWTSCANVFDFLIVTLCVLALPVYWTVPSSELLFSVILSVRFVAQLLRMAMILRHHCQRKRIINTTKKDIVDFTPYEDSVNIDYVQGKSTPVQSVTPIGIGVGDDPVYYNLNGDNTNNHYDNNNNNLHSDINYQINLNRSDVYSGQVVNNTSNPHVIHAQQHIHSIVNSDSRHILIDPADADDDDEEHIQVTI